MKSTRAYARRAGLTTAALVGAVVLAACGNGDDQGTENGATSPPPATASPSVPAGAHNDADVAFAKGMIPHHRQAIEMADLADERASSSEVKKLAEQIKKAQDPEIATMSAWLKAWGEEVPAGHMEHGEPSPMPGMLDEQQMSELRKASGAAFDTAFMEMMIMHHRGAIEMAEREKKEGEYAPAKKLADDIIKAQTAEIEQMNKLLGTD